MKVEKQWYFTPDREFYDEAEVAFRRNEKRGEVNLDVTKEFTYVGYVSTSGISIASHNHSKALVILREYFNTEELRGSGALIIGTEAERNQAKSALEKLTGRTLEAKDMQENFIRF